MSVIVEAALASALIPFGAAVALARLGARPGPAALIGLAVPAGFLTAFWLILGLPDWPVSNARERLFAAVAGLALLGAAADLAAPGGARIARLAGLGLPLAMVWIGHPALTRDPLEAGAALAPAALIAGLALPWLARRGPGGAGALGGALTALALGLACTALIGASASGAQLGLALAAALAGWTLGRAGAKGGMAGWLLAGGGALGGFAAIQMLFGGLAPWVFAPLALVPFAPLIAGARGPGAGFLAALAPAALAIGLAGWNAGLYG